MDPRILRLYNEELAFIRSSAAEFAREHPHMARRLALDGLGESDACPDPYVERLLEGFAYLTARIQLKIQARYSDLTHHLLEMIYPNFLAPVPSCTVLEFEPDLSVGSLQSGFTIDRGSLVRSVPAKGKATPIIFRTAHAVVLWPLEVASVRYYSSHAALSAAGFARNRAAKAAIRVTVKSIAGARLSELLIDALTFFIVAPPDIASAAYEQIHADAIGVSLWSQSSAGGPAYLGAAGSPSLVGFGDDEALWPVSNRSLRGYRLLQEYFALPERYRFFRVDGLRSSVQQVSASELDFVVELRKAQPALEGALQPEHMRLNCTPAINLFSKSLDRLHLDGAQTEQRLVPDRSRPSDYEVFSVQTVKGYAHRLSEARRIWPIYSVGKASRSLESRVNYSARRELNARRTRTTRSTTTAPYVGTDVYISLDQRADAHDHERIGSIDVDALCTNRDMAQQLRQNLSEIQFTLDGAAPVARIVTRVAPTLPRPSLLAGDSAAVRDTAWRLLSHLALNHLAISEGENGAALLREMLALYGNPQDASIQAQIDGVREVRYRTCISRLPGAGPIAYGRGLAVELELDDTAFNGIGVLPLASVLEEFFARQVSINAFVQTTLQSTTRGEVMRWPPRAGSGELL